MVAPPPCSASCPSLARDEGSRRRPSGCARLESRRRCPRPPRTSARTRRPSAAKPRGPRRRRRPPPPELSERERPPRGAQRPLSAAAREDDVRVRGPASPAAAASLPSRPSSTDSTSPRRPNAARSPSASARGGTFSAKSVRCAEPVASARAAVRADCGCRRPSAGTAADVAAGEDLRARRGRHGGGFRGLRVAASAILGSGDGCASGRRRAARRRSQLAAQELGTR